MSHKQSFTVPIKALWWDWPPDCISPSPPSLTSGCILTSLSTPLVPRFILQAGPPQSSCGGPWPPPTIAFLPPHQQSSAGVKAQRNGWSGSSTEAAGTKHLRAAIVYPITLLKCTQNLEELCKESASLPNLPRQSFCKRMVGLCLLKHKHYCMKQRNCVWPSFYPCYSDTVNVTAIKERKDVRVHAPNRLTENIPSVFHPGFQVKTLIWILIGWKEENNTFTVILPYNLNMGLSPMLFSVLWKWEQPPGKNVPQRYLIPIYVIF